MRGKSAAGGRAAVAAVIVDRFAPGGWTIVAAGLAGAVTALLRKEDGA